MSQSPPVQLLAEYGSQSSSPNKPTIRGIFEKYIRLEDTTYSYYDRSRADYTLHFHVESHNRCEVWLKPNLWDKGAYFVPNLLSEGALRVVPHFVRKKSREQVFQKRDARQQHALGGESSGAQAAYTVGRGAPSHATSPGLSSSNLVLLPTRSLSSAFEATTLSPPAPPPADTEDLTLADDTTPPPSQRPRGTFVYRNQYAAQRQNTVHPSQRHLPPLDPSLNGETWQNDFDAARKAYLDRHAKDPTSLTKMEANNSNPVAHRKLIEGKYGVKAAMACDACSAMDIECRTYHPKCYTWDIKGRGADEVKGLAAIKFLGWRCARCRYGKSYETSCNVQWE